MAEIPKKTWPKYFELVLNDTKSFDFRLADFDCRPGDTLVLQEWDPQTKTYTGRELRKTVTSVIKQHDLEVWPDDQAKRYGYYIISFKQSDSAAHPNPSDLPTSDSLRELQRYVWQMNVDRGFNLEDPSKKLVMLMEEMGELAKATRKIAGMKFTDTTKQTELKEELADVQIVLLGLASMLNVDMFDAVIAKETKNRQRHWK